MVAKARKPVVLVHALVTPCCAAPLRLPDWRCSACTRLASAEVQGPFVAKGKKAVAR